MASCRLGFLLLLLLTVHPGSSKAQHWSHGWYPGGKRASSSAQHPQHAPRLLASSPDQTAHNLPSDALAPPENSVPWEARTTGWWPLRRKQHLVKTLLPPAASKGVGGGVRGPRVPWCPAAASGSRDALRRAGRGGGLGHAARAASPGWGPPVWASGPAGAARAGPQDPPRPSGQVQGRARGDPAQGGSCRIVLADGALPAVPPDGVRPQAGVRVRGAEEGARGPVRGPGRAQGAAKCYRAPRPDGLEPGGEPAAARAAVSETAAGGAGAGAAAGGGESSAGQRGAGLGAAQGAGSAAAAGGSKKFHHSREPGGTGGRSFGLAKELQLGHHQRWAGGQATAQGLLRAQ